MPDREKVIKALTECIFLHEHPDDDAGCFECPYRPDEKGTCPTMIPFLKDVLELLKEQETIKPTVSVDTWICSKCGHTLESQELIDDKENPQVLVQELYEYCPHCGRAVKWDESNH